MLAQKLKICIVEWILTPLNVCILDKTLQKHTIKYNVADRGKRGHAFNRIEIAFPAVA